MERGGAMRWLVWLVIGAATVWGGLWFAASTALDRGARGAFAGMTARGMMANHAGIAVRGFPSRLDLTVTAPRLADPVTGAAYAAPFLQAFTLTWRPWHMIAAFAPEQTITTPAGEARLTAARMQASLVLEPAAALPLDRMTLTADELTMMLTATAVPGVAGRTARIAADSLRFATRRDPTRTDTHEIGLEILDIAPDPAFLAGLSAGAAPSGTMLPATITRLRITALAGLTAPLDRFADQTRPALRSLELTEATLDWGPLALTASGALVADADGLAEGRIDIAIVGWQAALDAATAAGLITPEVAPTWAELARRLTEDTPDPARLDLPLAMARGRMTLGLFPLGPAPRMLPGAAG